MATFSIGDWVKITPQPDLRWNDWSDTHTLFCGKIGTIREEFQDPTTNEICYDVEVNFPYGFDGNDAGWYYIHFRDDHLIKSTQYDSKIAEHNEKAAKDLQDWEKFKRKATDDALRELFVPKRRKTRVTSFTDDIKKAEESRSDVPEPVDFDPWDDITKEIVPLPGSATANLPDYDDDDIDYLLQQYNCHIDDFED